MEDSYIENNQLPHDSIRTKSSTQLNEKLRINSSTHSHSSTSSFQSIITYFNSLITIQPNSRPFSVLLKRPLILLLAIIISFSISSLSIVSNLFNFNTISGGPLGLLGEAETQRRIRIRPMLKKDDVAERRREGRSHTLRTNGITEKSISIISIFSPHNNNNNNISNPPSNPHLFESYSSMMMMKQNQKLNKFNPLTTLSEIEEEVEEDSRSLSSISISEVPDLIRSNSSTSSEDEEEEEGSEVSTSDDLEILGAGGRIKKCLRRIKLSSHSKRRRWSWSSSTSDNSQCNGNGDSIPIISTAKEEKFSTSPTTTISIKSTISEMRKKVPIVTGIHSKLSRVTRNRNDSPVDSIEDEFCTKTKVVWQDERMRRMIEIDSSGNSSLGLEIFRIRIGENSNKLISFRNNC